ncbi:hypothetical protein K474DRAFT_1776236 [Panus rudis PR-1116 ss-1]|nr:hypothetical protein K474DRAFT_1776236 [Panus rudis PR-1116 ss-1]
MQSYYSDLSLPSSPISSPSPGPADSSPPSSPNLGPSYGSFASPEVIDPFAASAKATKRPRIYEKRDALFTSELDEADSSFDAFDAQQSETLEAARRVGSLLQSSDDDRWSVSGDTESDVDEHDFWERQVSEAVDNGSGIINMSNSPGEKGLRFIPACIGDLANLVILPTPLQLVSSPSKIAPPQRRVLSRAVTAPAGDKFSTSPMGLNKTSSFTQNAAVKNPNEIHIFLANHQIRQLPLELFYVKNLTVLSMRHNQLRNIPPQISSLTNLRDLNIANNHLTYLPAEMRDMNIPQLRLNNNPWMRPPPNAARDPRGCLVSETKVRFTVPSLLEYSLRRLLSPTDPESALDETVLEALGGAAAIPSRCPARLADVLHACLPHVVPRTDVEIHPSPAKRPRTRTQTGDSKDYLPSFLRTPTRVKQEDKVTHPGIGVCPSPRHAGDLHKPIFVDHAEERYTWENVIAGCRTGEMGGVPILWRGCSRGCLDFLSPVVEKQENAEEEEGRGDMEEDAPDGEGDDGVEVVNLDSDLDEEFFD